VTFQDSASFSPRTTVLLIVAGVLAFAGAAYFSVLDGSARTSGTNSFSKSAIGHAAFLELLRHQDIPVVVSRNESGAKANEDSLLIVAEPLSYKITKSGGLPAADRTLLVLPKWRGAPDPKRPGWVGHVALQSEETVARVMSKLLPDATLTRPTGELAWKKTALAALHKVRPNRSDNDLLWARIRSRSTPTIDRPQFIVSETLTPIISSAEGVLVGGAKLDSGWLFVISDPDLLSNHGIGIADNAALMLDLLALFRPTDGAVIIDETVHGFRSNPNLWRKMFELPFLVATIVACAAILVLLGAATGRFGAPLPAERQRRESETGLIENAVDLLQEAGHGTAIVQRYPPVALRAVARRLHAPRRLNNSALVAWIDRVGTARGVKTSYRALRDEIENTASPQNANDIRVLRAVQRLYQWKQEMLDGPGRHSGN
jgi:hypothetical protein